MINMNVYKKLRLFIFSCFSCCFCFLLIFVLVWFVCVDKYISIYLFVGLDKMLLIFCFFCVCIFDSIINICEDVNICYVFVCFLVYKKLCLGVFGYRLF